MIRTQNKYIISLLILLASCSSEKTSWEKHLYSSDVLMAQESITEELLSSHIAVLSSDEFEGRKPATSGGKKTIKYLIEDEVFMHPTANLVFRRNQEKTFLMLGGLFFFLGVLVFPAQAHHPWDAVPKETFSI